MKTRNIILSICLAGLAGWGLSELGGHAKSEQAPTLAKRQAAPPPVPQAAFSENLSSLVFAAVERDKGSAEPALQALDERVDNVEAMVQLYEETSAQDLDARWSIIEAIAEIQAERGASFLAEIALRPMPDPLEIQPFPKPHSHAHGAQGCNMGSPSDQMLELAPRQWSAAAIARKFAVHAQTSQLLETLVAKVLQRADPRVSQYAAVSLFSHEALRPEHKEILDARGVFNQFRFLSDTERDALFDSSDIASARQDPQ